MLEKLINGMTKIYMVIIKTKEGFFSEKNCNFFQAIYIYVLIRDRYFCYFKKD